MEEKFLNTDKINEALSINDYAQAVKLLFVQQYETWKLNRDNYDMLKDVMTKSFRFGSYKIKVQFNPGRMHFNFG